jgi:FlaA1/EpsC-like NDP-sugar epimerase
VIFSLFQLYHSRRLSSVHEEVADIIKATCAGTAVLLVGAFIFNIRLVTPVFLLFFWASTTLGAMVSRLVLRTMLRQVRSRGRNLRNVIIVGTNNRALAFAKQIESRPDLGYLLKGFVDDAAMSKAIGTAHLDGETTQTGTDASESLSTFQSRLGSDHANILILKRYHPKKRRF